jgi:uncharacterized protein YfcZ (UPF0381/DUF406 family)
MHACLARATSRFSANADANDVGGGLARYWKIYTTGLGLIWYVIDTSCLVDGHPRVEDFCATRDEAEEYIANLREDAYQADMEPFEETYEIVARDHPVGDCRLELFEPFDIDDEHNMDADTAKLCGFV